LPKSILFCLYSHNVWGGIENWLHEILAAHSEAGWDVTLAAARGKRFNDPERFARTFGEVIPFDGRTGTAEGRITAVQRVIEKIRPSIVVPVGVGHALPAIGRAKARGVDTRLAFPLHAINAQLLTDAEEFAAIVDLIVGVNALQTKYLSRFYPPGRLVIVPNGTHPAVAAHSMAQGALRLLFAGRIDQHSKRVFDAVALAAELRRREIPFHYTIAGDGPSLPELKRQAPDFDYLGYVTPERLFSDIYPNADVVTVFSAIGEAFVLVAIEGMINGCVPVVSEWPGIHGAGYMKTGFVFPPGNIAKAADAIERLWRDSSLLAKMSRESMEIANEFTWSRTRRLWLEAMDALLTRKPVIGPFPMRTRVTAGRLDRLPMAEEIRRLLRRYPDFSDGWGEWPGTLSGVAGEQQVIAELTRLDREEV